MNERKKDRKKEKESDETFYEWKMNGKIKINVDQ